MNKKTMNKKWLGIMQDELILNRIFVHCSLHGHRRVGEVLGINYKTTWVKIVQGAKSYIVIKRDNVKHNVKFYREEEILANEAIHPAT